MRHHRPAGAGLKHAFEMQVIGVACHAGHLGHGIRADARAADLCQGCWLQRDAGGWDDRRVEFSAAAHDLGCILDGTGNRRVAGTATQGIFQRITDFGFAGIRVVLQQGVGGHDLTGDAKATLYCAVHDESFLQWVQTGGILFPANQVILRRSGIGLLRQPFDGQDFFTLSLG